MTGGFTMGKSIIRTVTGVTAAAGVVAMMALPAHAASAIGAGLTFYQGTFATPVLHVAEPDGACTPFPAAADSLAAGGPVQQVLAFRTADCSGTAVGLGTLRTFSAGVYHSFRAN
ncbi:hypothetical protein [Micromonospora cathayae]|uniref:Uncharacterized protein n=1 Tax=Micromonospora cathayae TaxID=3028804 RepID=A0ABY7ZXY7_9ACTN|nr:hypothetical protein [Micromonospora sp. HUAS 3]WDZ86604.1 hypothetical protein PVK37_09495 [Micromonospora sp. HUAS 3]